MYFPYLRGKQFEIEALLNLPTQVFRKTVPIVEPINTSHIRQYSRLAVHNIPFIFILNPYHPPKNRLADAVVLSVLNTELANHNNLTVGYLIDQRFSIADLSNFLNTNAQRRKAILFRFSPSQNLLATIAAALAINPVDYIIFDDHKANTIVRNFFQQHPRKILLTDGFQRQDRNSDYPTYSSFDSNFANYAALGWYGIGDYVTIGDVFKEGGGQAYVVTLHITDQDQNGLLIHHFSSTTRSNSKGFVASKFAEANNLLVNSPYVIPYNTAGLNNHYRVWHRTQHNPHLGAAKQASIMHHIELVSTLV